MKTQTPDTIPRPAETRLAEDAADQSRPFCDIPEASRIVRCSQATIRRLLTQKKLIRYKFGARTLIKTSELLALVRKAAE
jgi:excisionase family DNA binding protein